MKDIRNAKNRMLSALLAAAMAVGSFAAPVAALDVPDTQVAESVESSAAEEATYAAITEQTEETPASAVDAEPALEEKAEEPVAGEVSVEVSASATSRSVCLTSEEAEGYPSNEEAFAGYVQQAFDLEPEENAGSGVLLAAFGDDDGNSVSTPASNAVIRNRLDATTQKYYDLLKPMLAEMADGTRSIAKFEIAMTDILGKDTFTAAEVGVESFAFSTDEEKQASEDAISNFIDEQIDFDFSALVQSLLLDCPYELYWYDKTTGCFMARPGYRYSYDSSAFQITSGGTMTFYFSVAKDYLASSYQYITHGGRDYNLTADTALTGATSQAVTNARKVVSDAAASCPTDYEKLNYYRQWICDAVSYNHQAAQASYRENNGYGNPWQLIYVFDGDPSTNVVCEGYSKAFQFLCSQTDFKSSTIECRTVTGNMDEENHMWNLLQMDDGNTYMVDLTNCDYGTYGYPDKLFLKSPTPEETVRSQLEVSGDVNTSGSGYYFIINNDPTLYRYDSITLNTYTTSELSLAETDYVAETDPYDSLEKLIAQANQLQANISTYSDISRQAANLEAEIQAAQQVVEDANNVASEATEAYNSLYEAMQKLNPAAVLLSVSSVPSGIGVLEIENGYEHFAVGETVSVKLNETKFGYRFLGWYCSGELLSTSPDYSFEITEDQNTGTPSDPAVISLEAHFAGVSYHTLTVDTDGQGQVTVSGDEANLQDDKWLKGTELTLTETPNQGCTFLYWTDESGRILSAESTYPYTVKEDTTLYACYREEQEGTGQHYVMFLGPNNRVLQQGFVENSASVTPPSPPTFLGCTFTGWQDGDGETPDFDSVTGDLTVWAQYEAADDALFTLTVSGGTINGTSDLEIQRKYGTVITVTAPEQSGGEYFAGWYSDGALVSTQPEYTFVLTVSRSLEARYAEQAVSPAPVMNFRLGEREVLNASGATALKLSADWNFPEGFILQKAGILFTLDPEKADSLKLENIGTTGIYSAASTLTCANGAYDYTLTLGSGMAGHTVYACGYFVAADAVTGETYIAYTGIAQG